MNNCHSCQGGKNCPCPYACELPETEEFSLWEDLWIVGIVAIAAIAVFYPFFI